MQFGLFCVTLRCYWQTGIIMAHNLTDKKKRTLIFCLFSLFALPILGFDFPKQEFIVLDTVQVQVQYAVLFREAKEDKQLSTDRFLLEIGRRHSLFKNNAGSSTDAPQFDEPDPRVKLRMIFQERNKHKVQQYQILRNYPKSGKLSFWFHSLQYEEDIPELSWELEEGDSIVLDYPCQKASADFRGRRWTVWYAMDLPYSDGPWKLTGLPGLILHAHDAAGEFFFDAIDIRKGGEEQYIRVNKNEEATKSSPKEVAELQIRILRDFLPARSGLSIGGVPRERAVPRTAVLIEEVEKKKK